MVTGSGGQAARQTASGAAKTEAKNILNGLTRRGCSHSFASSTLVLLADGSAKPIAEVETGDTVVSTDPETGQTTDKQVVELHENHDTELTDLTVTTSDDKTTTLHTTQNHPFWSISRSDWIEAKDLLPGELLRAVDGSAVVVTLVHSFPGARTMHDLTVDDIHTYYVLAGTTPVLVHNCDGEAIVHLDRQAGHASVTVRHGADVLHTEQAGVPGSRAIAQEFDGALGNPRLDVRIPLPNASRARSFQDVTLGRDLGAYDETFRSCVTYCAEVLRQGGVEGIPIEEGSIAITKWLIRQHG